MAKLVSIIVPVFNREKLITGCIQSLKAQSHSDWELIIVDDGSTDNTVQVVENHQKEDERVRLYSRDRLPKGASTCRNIGMENANGEFIMFLDSDDQLTPVCLERRVQRMVENPELDFLVNQIGILDENSKVGWLWSSLKHEDDIEAFTEFLGWQTSSSFFRSGFVSAFSWQEDAVSWQDWEFHLHILLAQPNYKKLPDSEPDVLIDRGHGVRITSGKVNVSRLASRFDLLLGFEKVFEQKGLERLIPNFLMHYFRLLEQASIQLSSKEFEDLYTLWSKSATYKTSPLRSMRIYWKLHLWGGSLGIGPIQSINYRLSRHLLSRQLVGKKLREIKVTQ